MSSYIGLQDPYTLEVDTTYRLVESHEFFESLDRWSTDDMGEGNLKIIMNEDKRAILVDRSYPDELRPEPDRIALSLKGSIRYFTDKYEVEELIKLHVTNPETVVIDWPVTIN